ncbi:MAG: S1 RNA-binding domain-containing protein, partial [Clostridiales bacterium]|nr:S1 RNA-binding domain-containing protein [Clostridiales bacterium]
MSEKIEIKIGSIYEGKVVRLKPFGAIVSLPDNSQGLVHISHISNSYVQ